MNNQDKILKQTRSTLTLDMTWTMASMLCIA